MSFPIIDISGISNPDSQSLIADQVTEACKKWGFLLLKNHPIFPPDIGEMFSLSHSFFHLPESSKTPYPITKANVGYIGSFNDGSKDDKMSMWLGGDLEINKPMVPPYWQPHIQKIQDFKRQCHALVMKLEVAPAQRSAHHNAHPTTTFRPSVVPGPLLLECFALALGLPDREFFAKDHDGDGDGIGRLRMLMYPARDEKPVIDNGEGTRMIAHTDSNSVTLLFQRQPGLEVLSPDGKEWVKALYVEDCILINIGDALSLWSGNQLKATLHRVTFEGLPHDKERQSMAYFGAAHPDTRLKPIIPGAILEKYSSNGMDITSGITAGELEKMIMRKIYGPDY